MFAYCNNNPVIMEDASGTACRISITSETRIDEEPWRDHSPSGGGRVLRNYLSGSNDYGEIADKFYTVRFLRAVGDGVTTASNFLRDAYMRGYNLQQEAILLQAKMNIDMFDTPEDIERSLDIMDATIGFSIAVYKVATVVTAANPPTGAVIWAILGVLWGGRAVYKACL